MTYFEFDIQHEGQSIPAIATPFQIEDMIYYQINIPNRIFNIQPLQSAKGHYTWTDLKGEQHPLFQAAGEAIEKKVK